MTVPRLSLHLQHSRNSLNCFVDHLNRRRRAQTKADAAANQRVGKAHRYERRRRFA